MVKGTEVSRRGFGRLLGGLIGGHVVSSGNREFKPDTDLTQTLENSEYRIVSITDGYSDLSVPYDIEVKVEYGNPGEEVEYSRFLFEKDDLEESDLEIASNILEYAVSKNSRTQQQNIEIGRRIFEENFEHDTAEEYFARKIGETLEIEEALKIESIAAFDDAISKLNQGMGIEYKDGEFHKNRYSQSIDDWMQTGW